MAGMNKKMKKNAMLQEKMKGNSRLVVSSKKQVLTTPKSEWPRPDTQLLSMK